MGGIGSGKKLAGDKNIRKDIKVRAIRLDGNTYIGEQLKPFRVIMGYNLRQFEELSGIELSLICHFENRTGPMKAARVFGWNETAVNYMKALGIKEVTIKL